MLILALCAFLWLTADSAANRMAPSTSFSSLSAQAERFDNTDYNYFNTLGADYLTSEMEMSSAVECKSN